MTTYLALGTHTSNTAAPVFTMAAGDELLVGQNGTVANTSTGFAVEVTGLSQINVLGAVFASDNSAISVTGGVTAIWIGETGSVMANPALGVRAIELGTSDSSLVNHGQISSGTTAVGGTGGGVSVRNHGTIEGVTGISLEGSGSDIINFGTILCGPTGNTFGGVGVSVGGAGSSIINYGTIVHQTSSAVRLAGAAGEAVSLINEGSLHGGQSAISGSSSDDSVINTGIVTSRVTLGAGDDLFNNIGGRVDATVFLDAGDDVYVADASNATGLERINGGAGTDTIDFSDAAAAVWVNLAYNGFQAFTSGTAIATNANATTALARITGIENVIGSGGSDIVHGNALDNVYTYTGHHGAVADQFFGSAGVDTFDASRIGEMGSAVWVDLTLAGTDAWISGQETATNANATIQIAALDSVENVIGTTLSDRIFGSGDANTYFYNGNEASGPGLGPADFFDGRGGNDTIDFSLSPFSIWISLAAAGVEAWSSRGLTSTDANANTQIADLVSVENVVGSTFADTIRGSTGDNRLDASGAADAPGSTDLVLGLAGNDTFVYTNGYLLTRIGDFVAGGVADSIELSGFGSAFNTFEEIIAAATQVGADVEIDFGDGDVLTLANVTVGNLTASDFTFV